VRGDDGYDDAYIRARSPSPSSKLARWDFAREVLDALSEAGGVSAHHYVTTISFRDVRARHECLQLGLFIDAYLAMEVNGVSLPESSPLLDLLCRRLVGVLQADEHNNWSLAAATQRAGTSRLVGSDLFSALARAANSYDRVQRTASKGYGGGSGGAVARGRRRGKRGSRNGAEGQQPVTARGAKATTLAATGVGAAQSAPRGH
jgi:hypothetical protein